MPNFTKVDPMTGTAKEWIVSTPGTCGGKPRIDGHRIRVQDIVVWKEQSGMTVEEIIQAHPGLTPEKVEAALEYFRRHRAEIENDLKEDEEYADGIVGGPNIVIVRIPGTVDVGTNTPSSR